MKTASTQKHFLAGLLAFLSIIVVGCIFFLFRQSTILDPVLGQVTFKWRWGKAAEAAIDSNNDGLLDFRFIYHRWSTDFHTHEAYDEVWESSTCDGRLDRHITISNGQIERLNYDGDGDGVLEASLFGAAAIEYAEQNPRSAACGWGPKSPNSIVPIAKSTSSSKPSH